MPDETIDLNDPVVRELIDGAHADNLKLRDAARRVRTQAERDADGTTWRATAATRPGYATYPQTQPGSPSWWRHGANEALRMFDPQTMSGTRYAEQVRGAFGPPPVDGETCKRWCGFCHLGTGELPERTDDGTRPLPPIPDSAYPPDAVELEPAPRRRWWHRYTRRNP